METDLLAELIDQKHGVLIELRELSRRQVDVIDGGDTSKLISILAAKQKHLNRLQEIQRGLDPFRDQDPESREWRVPDDRERCRAAAERCEALLREIMIVERQCESNLIVRRDAAADQLQGTHRANEARTAYLNPHGNVPGGLNLTSEA